MSSSYERDQPCRIAARPTPWLGMRIVFVGMFLLSIATAGCRPVRDPIDIPPEALEPCYVGRPHLLVAAQSRESGVDEAVLRFNDDLTECRGITLPSEELNGDVEMVAGLSDGTDIVGVSGSSGGVVLGYRDGTAMMRLDDSTDYPRDAVEVLYGGATHLAVMWASRTSERSTRIDIATTDSLTVVASFDDLPFELRAIGAALGEQVHRMSGMLIGDGVQVYRADDGATSLAINGEPQVASSQSQMRSIDVIDGRVLIASDDGLLRWSPGLSTALNGPLPCNWPDPAQTPLPVETARYIDATWDLDDPSVAIALVDGDRIDMVDANTHLYRVQQHGECALIRSIPDSRAGVSIAWSGR